MENDFKQSRHDILAERLKKFAISVIQLAKSIPKTEENIIFIRQIIRSASSIGANYAEAMFAHSHLEFLHVMNICRKETNETKFWLELILSFNPTQQQKIDILIGENTQLLKIFISSIKTAKSSTGNPR